MIDETYLDLKSSLPLLVAFHQYRYGPVWHTYAHGADSSNVSSFINHVDF